MFLRLISMFVIHIFRRRLFNKKKLLKRSLLFSSPPNMDRSKFQIKRDKLFFFPCGWLLATFANNVTSWNVRQIGMSHWKAPNRDYTAEENETKDNKNLNFSIDYWHLLCRTSHWTRWPTSHCRFNFFFVLWNVNKITLLI